jgi:Ca2+-transporting ATPase
MVVRDHPTPVRTELDWYARTAEDVAAALRVDVAVGLPAATAAERLQANGPNALPEEKPKPPWRRFLGQWSGAPRRCWSC